MIGIPLRTSGVVTASQASENSSADEIQDLSQRRKYKNINCVLGSSLNTQAKFAGAIRVRSKNLQLEIVNINMNIRAPRDAAQPANALARSTRNPSGHPVGSGLRSARILARRIVPVARGELRECSAAIVRERTRQIQENRLPKPPSNKLQPKRAPRQTLRPAENKRF